MKKLIACVAVTALMFSGCALKSGNDALGKMDKTQVSNGIKKGKSTKEDVKAIFGDPEQVDLDNNGNEKWTYSYDHRDDKLINYIPYANSLAGGTNDKKKMLVILFSSHGVVKNYALSDSKGETKVGLFN